MAVYAKMPKMGLTMKSGTISKIKVSLNDPVKAGDVLMEFETDKITSEIESPIDGTVLDILAKEGEEVEVLTPLCLIGDRDEEIGNMKSLRSMEYTFNEMTDVSSHKRQGEPIAEVSLNDRYALASPLAKKLALKFCLSLKDLTGTGPNGRIVEKDVINAKNAMKVRATPLAEKLAKENGIDINMVTGSGIKGRIVKDDILFASQKDDIEEGAISVSEVSEEHHREKMSSMRKTIARRLQMSKQSIPHVYFRCEVDATSILKLKNTFSPIMQKKHGQKLSVNDIVLGATAAALKEFPVFNAQVDEDEIIYFETVNLGFAVNIENGLIVPVIRSADKLSLPYIAMEAGRLAERAKAKHLATEEYSGGTFTVSNLGGYGMEEFSAIINPPETGILAVGSIIEKAVIVDHQITVRPVMKMCLSVDHRLIDGVTAASFLKVLSTILEDVSQLLI
jgi:pyruvate dehydrogenase E2 component (dihydrolipoamide acetyltransferase)